MWWVGDLSRFEQHYPEWKLEYNVPQILRGIYDYNLERWHAEMEAEASSDTARHPACSV
jgi:CDP-paratose 2-epimerase